MPDSVDAKKERYLFFLNHSPEWLKIIEKTINEAVDKGYCVEILWESLFAKKLFEQHFPRIRSQILPGLTLNHCKNDIDIFEHPSYAYSCEIDRWKDWGIAVPGQNELDTYFSSSAAKILHMYDNFQQETYFIYEKPSSLIYFIIQNLNKKGFKVFYRGLSHGRSPGLLEIHSGLDLKNYFFGMIRPPYKSSGYSQMHSEPVYLKKNSNRHLLKGYINSEKLRRFILSLFFRRSSFQLLNAPISYFGFFKNRLKRNIASMFFKYDDVPDGEFALFPLHFVPEASTSLYSWWISSQYELIKTLAKSLQPNIKLVLKPHIVNVGKNYHLLNDLRLNHPNVAVISPHNVNDTLLSKAKLCLTINSTMIFDCLKYKVPVVYFGSGPYPNTNYCKRAEVNYNLPSIIDFVSDQVVPDSAIYEWLAYYEQHCWKANFGVESVFDCIITTTSNH